MYSYKNIGLFTLAAAMMITVAAGCSRHNPEPSASETPVYPVPTTSPDHIEYTFTGEDGLWMGTLLAELNLKDTEKGEKESIHVRKYAYDYDLQVVYNGDVSDLSSCKSIYIWCDTGGLALGRTQFLTESPDSGEFHLTISEDDGPPVHEYSEIKVTVSLDDAQVCEMTLTQQGLGD